VNQSGAVCCKRAAKFATRVRGVCPACYARLKHPRPLHTVEAALVAVEDTLQLNPVGALRLAAWALRREGGALRSEQGAACAALLAGTGAAR
jgi:hypothetical protein